MRTVPPQPNRWRVVECRQFQRPEPRLYLTLDDRYQGLRPVVMTFEPAKARVYHWLANNRPVPARYHAALDQAVQDYMARKGIE